MLRLAALSIAAQSIVSGAAAETSAGTDHFERHIRPLLVEKCYACHSAETVALGELRLDSKESMLRGGSRGAAIVAGDPGASLLMKAVSYAAVDLRMPPTGRLADQEIAHLEEWIRSGAPDPRAETAAEEGPEGIDLKEGREFWSFRPVREPPIPAVRDTAWARTDVDRFVLARMEAEGLDPAPSADRMSLIRRVSFDLTGLPPTPNEIEDFVADRQPGAYERVVERLLASPHYGERWGRHWLDLVRWAETNGHEFDNNKLDAWRYRDYVIESFNTDLPYDQFLLEQIAGDLLPPRLSADGTHNVGPIASGTYWLWEVLNSPTDSVKARADQIDNQIDVLSKATQGLTVACARCHDHKFDPIPTADYYSLFGVLESTHMSEICIDSPKRAAEIRDAADRIAAVGEEIDGMLGPALEQAATDLADSLAAAAEDFKSETPATPLGEELQYALGEPSHPLYPFARSVSALAVAEPPEFSAWMVQLRGEMAEWAAKADRAHPIWEERGDEVFEDFEHDFSGWTSTGAAFGDGPVRRVPPGQPLGGFAGQGLAASFGAGADALVGALTTEKFRMPARHVHVRMAGPQYARGMRENALARFTVIADEHKSGHAMPDGSGRLQWHSIAMTKERDRICSIEIVDRDRSGSIAVDQVVFSSSPKPPPIARPVDPRVLALLDSAAVASLADLAGAYRNLAVALSRMPDRGPGNEAFLADVLGLPKREDVADRLTPARQAEFNELAARRSQLDAAVPVSAFAMSSRDWKPRDSPIHVRGNHKNPGDNAPRQFLQVIAGTDQQPFRIGSGRLELANWVASDANPLTARVMANRVWQHHFGRGIVASPDNFGRTGEPPTHPALLDHLAFRLMDSGWSIKDLHREIVLSSAFRASSADSEKARELDPGNRLLSYFPVRRLEAEAIRDSVLAVSGALDLSVGGPGVPPHISIYQDGRGKPASGPLDGLGRRSVYLQLRRNFLPPLFLAFDFPTPISTAGRRGVSAVASQALMMLNNEFINSQAALWADRTLDSGHASAADRVRGMYLEAFGRPPVDAEVVEIERFLSEQSAMHGGSSDDPQVWADLAHAFFNTAEFLFVR